MKIPVLTLAILGGQVALAGAGKQPVMNVLDDFQSLYTGYRFSEGNFNPSRLVIGYAPWLVKGLVMKFARPLGAAPKIPFGFPVSMT